MFHLSSLDSVMNAGVPNVHVLWFRPYLTVTAGAPLVSCVCAQGSMEQMVLVNKNEQPFNRCFRLRVGNRLPVGLEF